MEDHGKFKWGESKQIGDQAIELFANLNKWFEKYLNSDAFQEAKHYMSDDDLVLLKEGFEIMEHMELWAVNYSEAMDRMEHKLDRIYSVIGDSSDLK